MRHFEKEFGSSIITPVLIESVTIHHILSQIPSIAGTVAGKVVICNGVDENAVNVEHRQLQTVPRPSWMRSFLLRHSSSIKKGKSEETSGKT